MKLVHRVSSSLALLGVLTMTLVQPMVAQQPLPSISAQGVKENIAPRLREDQAVQIAATFCQKMGLAVSPGVGTANAETLFPDLAPHPSQSPYMHPLWRVIFPRVATVRVDDTTGAIAFYSDDLLWGRHLRDSRPLTDIKAASQELVMDQALVALEAMGLQAMGADERLVLEQLRVRQDTAPSTVGGSHWSASWLRVFHGLPFRGQNLTMQFDPESGQLFLLSLNYTQTAPRPSLLNISPEVASRLITQHLSNALPDLLKARSDPASKSWMERFKNRHSLPLVALMRLEVVQPNDFWQPQKLQEQRGNLTLTKPGNQTSSRVCWTGRYNVGTRDYEV
jgi:hypothetical protein